MAQQTVAVSINLDPSRFQQQFATDVATCMANLSHTLRSLEAGTFKGTPHFVSGVAQFIYAPTDDVSANAGQQAIHDTFGGVMAAFITFLDRMIAMQVLIVEGLRTDRALSGEEEIREWAEAYLQNKIKEVSTKTALTNPKKIVRFGISQWAVDAVLGYFGLRRCLEHHAAIATEEIPIRTRSIKLVGGDEEITTLPFLLEKGGALALGAKDENQTFHEGEQVKLTEGTLQKIVGTLMTFVVSEILIHFTTGPQSLQSSSE